jgi:uncharacterized protein YdaU (DUF1376 family)
VPAKPPAFQFYVKDWRSSHTVRRMSWKDRGIYLEILIGSWESDEPGTIPLPLSLGAKVLGVHPTLLRSFLDRYPSTFYEVNGRLVNHKLHTQWLQMKRVSEAKTRAANIRHHPEQDAHAHAHAYANGMPASASASATSNTTPPTPPQAGGESFLTFCRETIAVQMNGKKRLLTKPEWDSLQGGRAEDLVELLRRKGFNARIVRTQ